MGGEAGLEVKPDCEGIAACEVWDDEGLLDFLDFGELVCRAGLD